MKSEGVRAREVKFKGSKPAHQVKFGGMLTHEEKSPEIQTICVIWGEAIAWNSGTTRSEASRSDSEGEKLHTLQWEVDCAKGKSDAAMPNEVARPGLLTLDRRA